MTEQPTRHPLAVFDEQVTELIKTTDEALIVTGWYLVASTYHPEHGHRNIHHVPVGQAPIINVGLAASADRFMRS
jgi:hypothetical protein